MEIPIKWNNTGKEAGLCSDISPKDITESRLYVTGPETGALNVRNVGHGTNVTPDYELILGNVFSYIPDPVTVQNKVFRVSIKVDAIQKILQIFDGAGKILQTAAPIQWDSNVILSQVYANAALAISSAVFSIPQTFVIGPLVATSLTVGYFTLSVTTIPSWDYSLLLSDVGGGNLITPIVEKEAIDSSMIGDWRDVSNNDQIGDLFHFWTTRLDNPKLTISGVENDGSGSIKIITTLPHGLQSGRAVLIENAGGVPNANAVWIISVINATAFILLGSVMASTYTGGGNVQINPYGLGEIGVAVKNEDNQTWTYTTLLRSKKFNFSVQYLIDCRFKRKNDGNIAGYFVEGGNNPRVFYYKGVYITNGALTINGGQYEYDSLYSELKLIISTGGEAGFSIQVDADAQIQIGGALPSGNWRYAADFLTDKLSESGYTQLTNAIPVFTPSVDGAARQLGGDIPLTITGKKNVLNINTPVEGLFKFVKIAAVNYLPGGAFQGLVIGIYLLTGTETIIIHSGNEQGTTDLDLGTLNTVTANIDTAENVELSQNRAILSNLTAAQEFDFLSFTKTFKHKLIRKSLIGVGNPVQGTYKLGEYADPENVYSFMGRMHNETYAEGCQFRLKNGVLTPFYWIDFIRIDTNNTNLANPSDNRRISGLPNYDLTNNDASEVYSAGIEFSNINLDFLINGISIRELVSEIIFGGVDISKDQALQDVLGAGVMIKSTGNSAKTSLNQPVILNHKTLPTNRYSISPIDLTGNQITHQYPMPPPTDLFEFPGASRFDWDCINNPILPIPNGDLPYTTNPSIFWNNNKYCFGYLIDQLFGQGAISLKAGDLIFNYGSPTRYATAQVSTLASGLCLLPSEYAEYNGRQNIVENQIQKVGVSALLNISCGNTVVDNGLTFHRAAFYCRFDLASFPVPGYSYAYKENNPDCILFKGATGFNDVNTVGNTDYGLHYFQYIRPKGTGLEKYGDQRLLKYIPRGVSYIIIPSEQNPTIEIFGGDVFTQKTYIKNRIPTQTPNTTAPFHNDSQFTTVGGGSGIGIYAQSRVNTQLKTVGAGKQHTGWDFPNLSPYIWLEDHITIQQNPIYNSGYNINNGINKGTAFDPTANHQIDWRNAFIWSDPEGDGTVTDQLRRFPPLNIKFLDYTNGAITDLRELNGEIVTIQPYYVERQYYNTTNVVTSTEGAEVILGQSGVFARRGVGLSNFGTNIKGSIVIGFSDKGQQNMYFWDLNSKAIVRIGYDGSNSLDEIHGIKSFIANNTQYLIDKFNLGAGEGITAVANQKYREVIWTVNGVSSDGLQKNNYTLVWSELKNVFQAFHSYKYKRYARFGNTFLSILDNGKACEHDRGLRGVWQIETGTLEASGFYSGVVNVPKDTIKWPIALRYFALRAPDKVTIETVGQKTFMLASDFTNRENAFSAPVKMDSTITPENPTGRNDLRTSRLNGPYAIITTFIFASSAYQAIGSFISKLRVGARTFNK